MEDENGLLKWGVSQDPKNRHMKEYMVPKVMTIVTLGSRREMLDAERELVETLPGRINREPWAGIRMGEVR